MALPKLRDPEIKKPDPVLKTRKISVEKSAADEIDDLKKRHKEIIKTIRQKSIVKKLNFDLQEDLDKIVQELVKKYSKALSNVEKEIEEILAIDSSAEAKRIAEEQRQSSLRDSDFFNKTT